MPTLLKLHFIAVGLTFSFTVASAQVCEKVPVQFSPHAEAQKGCENLGFSGFGSLTSCAGAQGLITNAKNGEFEVRLVNGAWKFQSFVQDFETRDSFSYVLEVDFKQKSFKAINATRDSRGHLRSQILCSGTVALQ